MSMRTSEADEDDHADDVGITTGFGITELGTGQHGQHGHGQ